MKKLIENAKFMVFTFAMLIAVILLLGVQSNIACAATELTSDDGLWKFNTDGQIKNYLGSDTVVTIPAQLTSDGVTYNITKIPWSGLSWNNTITQINIGSNITSIDNAPFVNMTSLINIEVADQNQNYCDINGVLYDKAKTKLMRFPQMNAAEVLEFPDTFVECNINALENCTNVHILKIPASYTERTSSTGETIDGTAFPNLTTIEVMQGNTIFSSEEGVLYNYDKTTLVWYPCKKSATSFTFPNSVTAIQYRAFQNVAYLQNLNLTPNIEIIDDSFLGCNITSINNITTRQQYLNWDPTIKAIFQANLNAFGAQPFTISLVDQEVQYAVDNYIEDGMNDYQKIKALYNYVANKVSYTTGSDIGGMKDHCISTIFLTDTSVCEGYALGMSLLLDKVGIENCPVSGGNHAWNLVKINDIWLELDPTWDDKGNYMSTRYFLKTTAEYTQMLHPQYVRPDSSMTSGAFTDFSYGVDKLSIYWPESNLPQCNAIIGDIAPAVPDGVFTDADLYAMVNEIRGYFMYGQYGYYNVKADMNRDGAINQGDYDLLYELVNAA